MILLEPDKTRARIHQGVPVLGVQDSGFALGYRYTNVIGLFEYRMNNIQPWEYSKLTGYACGAIAIQNIAGHPQVGDTIVATVGALSAFTYTVQSSDLLAPDPVFAAVNSFCNAWNAVNGATYIAGPQPTVSWPPSYNGITPLSGPNIWQISFTSFGTAAFGVTGSSNHFVVANIASGLQVNPQVTFNEDQVTCYGYLAILDYLQAKTATSSDLAKFAVTGQVTMRYDELGYRDAIYMNWRQKTADYWGIPLFPMKTSGPARNTGLVM